jgi:DNA helicase-2/ATP-dependent DNA helicase PcrA
MSDKVVVNAVPGAGKTTMIVSKINEYIDRGISPCDIYALTFTNSAANVMKARVNKDVNISTIHSLAYSLLLKYNQNPSTIHNVYLRDAIKLVSSQNIKLPTLVIDEAQDLNELQFRFLEPLVKRADNVFVVGDPMQSIYGFQGSSPKYMNLLVTDGTTSHSNVSYRLKEEIADYVNLVFDTEIQSNSSGSKVLIINTENKYINKNNIVASLLDIDDNNGSSAILFRTNGEVINFITSNINHKYKFNYSFDISYNPYIALISILSNDNLDLDMFLSISRYFGYSDFKYMNFFGMVGRYLEKIDEHLTLDKLYDIVVSNRKHIHGIVFDYTVANNVSKVIELIREFKRCEELNENNIKEYIKNFMNIGLLCPDVFSISEEEIVSTLLSTQRDRFYYINNESDIDVITMHASKGQEFNKVICVEPSNHNPEDEEERRLMYVAMTRAVDKLYMVLGPESVYNYSREKVLQL